MQIVLRLQRWGGGQHVLGYTRFIVKSNEDECGGRGEVGVSLGKLIFPTSLYLANIGHR